jgi:3-hydroxybutyryl-CoA dehydrogenase
LSASADTRADPSTSTVAPARTIGVIGAGTMGAGIAQLACLSGARTLLHDPIAEALGRGAESVRANLERGAARGRYEPDEAREAAARLEPVGSLDELAPCELVIEAAPESLELKHELFARLSEVVADDCVLATNTSSLPVTAIAAGATRPERVVGMHFFNPAPLMALLEVVAGMASDERSLAIARATGEAMGRRVIDAADGPGFLVNRCNRPFGLEALRMLSEGLAPFAAIDRICRLGGGFRMGPFELSDLVGVDVGFAVSRSFYEQSFGEPRWRPSPLQARIVAAGRLGRKTGQGWYSYGDDPYRPEDPEQPAAGGGDGLVVIAGDGVLASELLAAAAAAGWDARTPEQAEGEVPELGIDCGAHDDDTPPPQGGPRLLLCDVASLAELDPGGSAAGFHALAPLDAARLVELTRGPHTSTLAERTVERFFATLGKHVEWVGDAPGLVLGRIVCQIVNEAAFALGEGVGSAADIDAGMVLGMNHPRGPLEWADLAGLDHVLGVLEGLCEHYREERYRPAPELRRLVLDGRLGRHVGAGFHLYDDAP